MVRWIVTLGLAGAVIASTALAQAPPGPPRSGPVPRPGPAVPQGPPPTHADLDYAPPDPPTSNGHKLDLYLPAGAAGPLPVVVWTSGSAGWRTRASAGRGGSRSG